MRTDRALSRTALALLLGLTLAGQDKPRPNIVFICTDDQAAWTLGALGNPDARTPHVDRLVREGARFTNAFVTTPVCSPSRGGLMASRYGTELGITDYLNASREPDLGLDPNIAIWPEVLQQAGYATAFVGKWHIGGTARQHPTRNGYDYFAGFRYGAGISLDPEIEIGEEVTQAKGFTPDVLTDHAIEFIRGNTDGPFLVNLHFWAPHANTQNRTPDGDRTWLPLDDKDWDAFRALDPRLPEPDYPDLDVPRVKRMMREYLASVASVDRNVGRLLAELDRLELVGNTIVVFTSDHGYNMGHHGIWHKGNGRWVLTNNRGARPNLYDNSLRVPLAVRWPGVVEPGAVIGETVTNLDWYPTLLAMAGATVPETEAIRGRNFLPLLRGRSIDWDNDLFAQYSQHHSSTAQQRAYRSPEWKLVRDFAGVEKDELYHLAADPAEKTNLIDSQDPAVLAAKDALTEKLAAKMHEISDPLLGKLRNP